MDESQMQKSILSESELKQVLNSAKGKDAEIVTWKTENFTKKGDHYFTDITAIKVEYQLEGTTLHTSFVVKHTPDPFNMVEGLATAYFKKEVLFYSNLAPSLFSELEGIGENPLRMPKCFLASIENEKIVMEDLRLTGFKMHDRRKPLDVPHVILVLRELARLHAAGLLLQMKNPEENLEDKYEFLKVHAHNYADNAVEWQQKNWLTLMETIATYLSKIGGYETAEAWLTKNKKNGLEILLSHLNTTKLIQTICHGDCWVNNLLFRYNGNGDPVEVMFVDLQVCRKSSPVIDLQYLFSTCLEGQMRKDHLDDLLSIYYSAFASVLEKGGAAIPYTLKELQGEFKDKLSYGLLFGIFIMNLTLSDSNDLEEETNNMGKLSENLSKRSEEMEGGNELMKSRILALIDNVTYEGFSF